MKNPSFRTAAAADADRVLALIGEYYAYDGIAFDATRIAPALRELLTDDSLGRVLLFELGGETAGYLIATFAFDLEYGGRMAVITDFYLREPFRHRGIGTLAMEHLAGLCPSLGVRALELQVERDNPEAQSFYSKQGFRALDRIPMNRRLPG